MKTQNLTISFYSGKTPKEVFAAINNVSGWWTMNIEGETKKPNDVFTVRFGDIWKKFKVAELVPNKKVVWQVMDSYITGLSDSAEWNGTKISFEITEKDGKTDVRFTHLGLVPKLECYDACSNAWNYYIHGSLRNLISKGKGTPDPADEKKKAARN